MHIWTPAQVSTDLCVQDDEDNGDSFTYTGAGGRDLSGNKRTAEQSFDQVLNKSNAAIAR